MLPKWASISYSQAKPLMLPNKNPEQDLGRLRLISSDATPLFYLNLTKLDETPIKVTQKEALHPLLTNQVPLPAVKHRGQQEWLTQLGLPPWGGGWVWGGARRGFQPQDEKRVFKLVARVGEQSCTIFFCHVLGRCVNFVFGNGVWQKWRETVAGGPLTFRLLPCVG